MAAFWATALAAFALDRVAKMIAVRTLAFGEAVPVLRGLLELRLTQNRGMALGLLSGNLVAITALPVLVVVAGYLVLRRYRATPYTRLAAALVLGGFLGNLVDRITAGYVLDMVYFPWMPWYICNPADIAICLGVALLWWSASCSARRTGGRKGREAPMKRTTFAAPADGRLDVLAAAACGVTRSRAAKWIAEGLCHVNGLTAAKAGVAVRAGDLITVDEPDVAEAAVQKEDIPLSILYQDDDVAVVVKPRGMVVHPAGGNETGTLVNALLFALDGLSGIGGVKRPGIVHRLDKDTSGVLLVAKNDAAHLALSAQLRDRTMEKHYLAVVEGVMKAPRGEIDKPVGRSPRDRKKMAVTEGGRPARTEWTLLEPLRGASLLDVHLLTGRTHQIRVHMQSAGHPVAGDSIYGLKHGANVSGLMLHAHTIAFTHPRTGERMAFTAPPPEDFLSSLARLRVNPLAPLPFR